MPFFAPNFFMRCQANPYFIQTVTFPSSRGRAVIASNATLSSKKKSKWRIRRAKNIQQYYLIVTNWTCILSLNKDKKNWKNCQVLKRPRYSYRSPKFLIRRLMFWGQRQPLHHGRWFLPLQSMESIYHIYHTIPSPNLCQ